MNKYFGEIEPIYGKWVWPFKAMEGGDWFTVDQMLKDKGSLANYAYVQGHRMGKRFSVTEELGRTKVMCLGEPEQKNNKHRTEIDFQTVMGLIERCYGKSGERAANQLMGWTMDEGFVQTLPGLTMIEVPPVKQVMVTTINTTALCEFFNNGLRITVVKPGMTLQEWLTS